MAAWAPGPGDGVSHRVGRRFVRSRALPCHFLQRFLRSPRILPNLRAAVLPMGTLMVSMTTQLQDPECSTLSDRDLLRRFLQDEDQLAFAAIVRRHQQLVLSVSRRILSQEDDVEDAFQATFIALARRPRSIRQAASLSSWLYTVAWRMSWRLIRQRRNRVVEPLSEHPAQEPPGPLDRIASAQDCHIVDEELNLLPDRYREVLVMTYFADRTSQQIADELNVSKGTVDGRLRQAKNLLRVRLARRGVGIAALALVAGLTSTASAASATLLQSTITIGTQTLAGSVPAASQLSRLESLVRPETTMLSSKLIATGVMCASAMVGAAGLSLFSADHGSGEGSGQPAVLGAIIENNAAAADANAVVVAATVNPAQQAAVAPTAAAAGTDESASEGLGASSSSGNEGGFGAADFGGGSLPATAGAGYAVGMEDGFPRGGSGGVDGNAGTGMAGADEGFMMGMGSGPGLGGFGAMGGAGPYPDPQTRWLHQVLQQPVGAVELTEPTLLDDALLRLADSLGDNLKGGPLKLKIDDNLALRGAPADSLTTSRAFALTGMPLHLALSQVVKDASRSTHLNLRWQIQEGAILVSAVDSRHFTPYPADARPNEKWMHEILEAPIKALDFPGETPLTEILDMLTTDLSDTYGGSQFQLKYIADRGELEAESIASLDDVTIRDVDLNDITLRHALDLIFEQTNSETSAPVELTWVIHNEVLFITTVDRANSSALLSTRVYPVGHLLFAMQGQETAAASTGAQASATPVQFSGGGMGGFGGDMGPGGEAAPAPIHPLLRLVMSMTADQEAWYEHGGPGQLDLFGDNLVVRQTPNGHDDVVRLLNLLSNANEPGRNLQNHQRRTGSGAVF